MLPEDLQDNVDRFCHHTTFSSTEFKRELEDGIFGHHLRRVTKNIMAHDFHDGKLEDLDEYYSLSKNCRIFLTRRYVETDISLDVLSDYDYNRILDRFCPYYNVDYDCLVVD